MKQTAGGVILFNAEDDVGDTIAPRLDLAGADDTRILVVEGIALNGKRRPFTLETDLPRLDEVLVQNIGTRLVVIDPIAAYCGEVDSHSNTDVRGMLAPLAELASNHSVAVVAVTHMSKSGTSKAVYRAMGSLAFAAASRAVWAIVKDQNDPKRRLFLPVKANLSQDGDGLAYRIVDGRVQWETEPVRLHADDAIAAETASNDERGNEQREAAEWLRSKLTAEPRSAGDLIEEGEQYGFNKRTLQRAFKTLGGESARDGAGWTWALPAPEPPLPSPGEGSPG